MLSPDIFTSPDCPDVFCVVTYLDGRLVMAENLCAADASRRWMDAKAENDLRGRA